jgi:hypothetical protein
MHDLATLITQARAFLEDLGLPKQQTNERAALVLLALLDLRPGRAWSEAKSPLRGIRSMMDYVGEHLGKRWAENTRETVRRFTIHQFVHAGIALRNPDDLSRATNSPHTTYQAAPPVVALAKLYRQRVYERALVSYRAQANALRDEYKAAREAQRIPLKLPNGVELWLTPGGQSPLVRAIVEEFCPIFTPGAYPVYVGDTGSKLAHFDQAYLRELGVEVQSHGQIPDVVVHDQRRDWLILIEAVTSHGPMNAKRLRELKAVFHRSRAGLVFVTAFKDRATFSRYLIDIAWETEVWIAEDPTHMIHFNGERFLGPYDGASGDAGES